MRWLAGEYYHTYTMAYSKDNATNFRLTDILHGMLDATGTDFATAAYSPPTTQLYQQ
jgi:hypothetical protein